MDLTTGYSGSGSSSQASFPSQIRLSGPAARSSPTPLRVSPGFPPGSPCAVRRATLPGLSRPDYYGNPSGETNDIDVVRAIYAAFAERDLEGAQAFLATDCELHLRGTQDRIGRTEPYKGHDGMREYFADVERTWEEL